MVTRKLYWTCVPDHLCLLISQIGQAALPQAFRPCGTENTETVETDLEKLINRVVIMTLLYLTQSWTGIEINPILEMTFFIWMTVSEHFQRHI